MCYAVMPYIPMYPTSLKGFESTVIQEQETNVPKMFSEFIWLKWAASLIQI